MVSETGLIAILTGPTATGKTAFALELASQVPEIEIVNADSLLVYRQMNIGTAKPSAEELARVPHHLIDILNPDEPYAAGDFVRDVHTKILEIQSRGHRPLIVGGTGFYLKALLFGLWPSPKSDPELRAELEARPMAELYAELEKHDPQSAYRIGPNDRYRLARAIEHIRLSGKTPSELQASQPTEPDPRFELLIVDRPSAELEARIAKRTNAMLAAGLLDEVARLREQYPGARPLSSVGYAEACAYLDGTPPAGRKIRPGLPGLQDEIQLATRQLVKRQRTWFRGQSGPRAKWFELDREGDALRSALRGIYAEKR